MLFVLNTHRETSVTKYREYAQGDVSYKISVTEYVINTFYVKETLLLLLLLLT
jgi:hypothetical protein